MGESSFSKGFGQVKPNEPSDDPQMDETWKSVPRAIFDGLADRYKVRFQAPVMNVLLMSDGSIVRLRQKVLTPDWVQCRVRLAQANDYGIICFCYQLGCR
jgi:hypothetical protein